MPPGPWTAGSSTTGCGSRARTRWTSSEDCGRRPIVGAEEIAMSFAHPEYLVSTDWLLQRLGDPAVRVLECTVNLVPDPVALGGFRVESGRGAWGAGHIPGAGFVDLPTELSDRTSSLRFMMPPAAQFADAMSRHGVGAGVRVVLYDRAVNMWAARVWWMLRAFGFDDAAVLDGGWKKWTVESRPVATDAGGRPARTFTPRPRPELFVDKAAVLAGIDDGATCVLNA